MNNSWIASRAYYSEERIYQILNEIRTEETAAFLETKQWKTFEREYQPEIFKYDIVGRSILNNLSGL